MSFQQTTSSTLAALTLVAITSVVNVASGQENPPSTDPPELPGAAQALFKSAHAAREAKDYQACYERAHGAWRLKPTGGVSALIGDCAFRLQKYREAAERLTWFFDHLPTNPTPRLLTEMKERLALSKQHVATVEVSTNVPGARLLLDGQPAKSGVVFVDPGTHVFEAKADGYQPTTVTGTFGPGTDREIALPLKPVVHETPPPPPPPSPGAYPWVVGVGAAGALIGAGLAIGFTVAANGKASDAEDLQADIRTDHPTGCTAAIVACSELDDALATDTLHNAALGLWIGTGSVALLTAAYAIFASPSPSSSVTVVPAIGPTQAGLSATFSF